MLCNYRFVSSSINKVKRYLVEVEAVGSEKLDARWLHQEAIVYGTEGSGADVEVVDVRLVGQGLLVEMHESQPELVDDALFGATANLFVTLLAAVEETDKGVDLDEISLEESQGECGHLVPFSVPIVSAVYSASNPTQEAARIRVSSVGRISVKFSRVTSIILWGGTTIRGRLNNFRFQ